MLTSRGVPPIPEYVKLSSDPGKTLLVQSAGDIYTSKMEAGHGPTYEMVQPAIVVLDTDTGEAIKECTWSWKTMGLTSDQLNETYEVEPGKILVLYRPVISDLRASIKERRPVRLNSTRSFASAMGQYIKAGDFVNFLRSAGILAPLTKGVLVGTTVLAAALLWRHYSPTQTSQ